jgi:hypothetical protein
VPLELLLAALRFDQSLFRRLELGLERVKLAIGFVSGGPMASLLRLRESPLSGDSSLEDTETDERGDVAIGCSRRVHYLLLLLRGDPRRDGYRCSLRRIPTG